MAVIKTNPVAESNKTFDKRQIVRVTNGLYGGLFAWYSLPKDYPKYKKPEETEQKFFAGFVLTHDRSNQQLPHFSQASLGVKPKLFYNAESNMVSTYTQLLYVLNGGKLTREEICSRQDWDLDEFIGKPAILFVQENNGQDANSNYTSRITSMEPADNDLIKVVLPLYKERKTEEQDIKGTIVTRLVYPAPEFEEDVEDGQTSEVVELPADPDSELPF